MGSNFGGDGGDTSSTRPNGCNIAQEYVYLAVKVTQNCAVNDGAGSSDPRMATSSTRSHRRTTTPARPASSRRSPSTRTNSDTWIAGGQHVWVQHPRLRHPQRRRVDQRVRPRRGPHRDRGAPRGGGVVYAGWCGPCNNAGLHPRHRGRQRRRHRLAPGHPARRRHRAQPVPGRLRHRPGQRQHVVRRGQRLLPAGGPRGRAPASATSSRPGRRRAPGRTSRRTCPTSPPTRSSMATGARWRWAPTPAHFYRAPGAATWPVLGNGAADDDHDGPRRPARTAGLYAATHGRGIWSITPPA